MRFISQVYTEDNHWDCIATCFFIDCANNVVQFIETIYKILKPGGVWINLGPLLYHFSDLPNEDSIEPSYDAIRDIILGFGFKLEVTYNFLLLIEKALLFVHSIFVKASSMYHHCDFSEGEDTNENTLCSKCQQYVTM